MQASKTFRVRRGWIPTAIAYGGAMLPLALAIVASASGPQWQPPEDNRQPHSLVFDQYLVNLGHVPPERMTTATFAFRNAGSQTVTIREIVPSCGCLTPRLEKRTYAPGEHGEFQLNVATPNQPPGAKDYTVDVLYEDTESRSVELAFKVHLPKQVLVRPAALKLYEFGDGQSSQHEIVITDFRAEPLSVTALKCLSPLVTAEVVGTRMDAQGNHQIVLKAEVTGDVLSGTKQASLEIHTSDPDYSKLEVPMVIETRRRDWDRSFGEDLLDLSPLSH